MGKNAAPGSSLAAQLREGRAKLRRDARKRIERAEQNVKAAQLELEQARVSYAELERSLKGQGDIELQPAEP